MTGRKKRTGEQGDSSIPSPSSSHLSKKEKEDFQFQDVETGRNRARSKSREYYDPLTSRKVKEGEAKPERDLKLAEETTRRDINGTVDLTVKEKEMMILWNRFMFKEDKVASYCEDIGPLVLRFAQSFGKEIMDRDLSGEFLIHMINLQDFGQLKQSADIQRAVAIVKSTVTNPTTAMEPETITTNNENDAIATASSSTQEIPAASGYSDDATQMLVTIFSPRPRVSLGGTQGDLLADIAKYKKQVNACLVYFSEIRDIIEIKETKAQNAAKRQSEVNDVTPKDFPNFAERMSLLEVLDQTMEKLEKAWAQVKVLESRIRNLRPIMRSSGGQVPLGEAPPPREDSARLDMAICCARTWLNSVVAGDGAPPASVPPVEIQSGPDSQKELQLEVPDDPSGMAEVDLAEGQDQDLDLQKKPVNPGTVQVTQDSPSFSKPEKKDGAAGTRRGMDKKGLLAFMDGLESRDRDKKKSELEHGGVPAPAPIDKNLIAQDLALDDSQDSEDSEDDDDEDDEIDLGSDASPSPKKMKLSADANAARMNPSVEKERANYEATKTKGKGDGAPTKENVPVPVPSPAVAAVESGARPSLLTGSSASKPTSAGGVGAASGSGFGTRPGAFPLRRSFPFGNNDNDNKPKLHKTCDYCGKPFTNMELFFKHQKKHASKPLELTVD